MFVRVSCILCCRASICSTSTPISSSSSSTALKVAAGLVDESCFALVSGCPPPEPSCSVLSLINSASSSRFASSSSSCIDALAASVSIARSITDCSTFVVLLTSIATSSSLPKMAPVCAFSRSRAAMARNTREPIMAMLRRAINGPGSLQSMFVASPKYFTTAVPEMIVDITSADATTIWSFIPNTWTSVYCVKYFRQRYQPSMLPVCLRSM